MLALLLLLQTVDPVTVADGASQPHLAFGPDGNPAVVFLRNGNIEIALSKDKGKSFPAPLTAIDAAKRARGVHQRGPRVAIDGQKKIYVTAFLCFDAAEIASAQQKNDLYLATSTDGGKTFTKPLRINDVPKMATESLHWTAPVGGNLLVAWIDKRAGKGLDLQVAVVDDAAPSKSTTVAKNVSETCAPGLAANTKGQTVLVWREGPPTRARRTFYALAKDSGGSFDKPLTASTAPTGLVHCPGDAPAAAVSPDGKSIALAWMDLRDPTSERNVYWTVGPPGKLPEEVPSHDNRIYYQGHPTVAFDKNNTAWCAWEDSRHGVQQIFVADWTTKKNFPITEVSEGKGAFPSFASGGGVLGIAYELNETVAFRILAIP